MFSSQPALPDYTQASQFDLNRMMRLAARLYQAYQASKGLKLDLNYIYKLDLILEVPKLPHTHYDLKFNKNKILYDHMTNFLTQHKVIFFVSDDPDTMDKIFFIFKGKLENAKLDSSHEVEFLSKIAVELQVDLGRFAKLPEQQAEKLRVSYK